MPGYSQQDLDRARQPLRSDLDRGDAVCVLGHLLTEQREAHSDDRATTIRAITAAVQDFDTRTALGAPAARFTGTEGVPAVASIAAPPVQPAPVALGLASTQASGALVANTSMRRELQRQGLTASAGRTGSVDVLGGQRATAAQPGRIDVLAASKASMERELKKQGLTARDRG